MKSLALGPVCIVVVCKLTPINPGIGFNTGIHSLEHSQQLALDHACSGYEQSIMINCRLEREVNDAKYSAAFRSYFS